MSCELWWCRRYPVMARAFGHAPRDHRALIRSVREVSPVNSTEPESVLINRFLHLSRPDIEAMYQVGRVMADQIEEAQARLRTGREKEEDRGAALAM